MNINKMKIIAMMVVVTMIMSVVMVAPISAAVVTGDGTVDIGGPSVTTGDSAYTPFNVIAYNTNKKKIEVVSVKGATYQSVLGVSGETYKGMDFLGFVDGYYYWQAAVDGSMKKVDAMTYKTVYADAYGATKKAGKAYDINVATDFDNDSSDVELFGKIKKNKKVSYLEMTASGVGASVTTFTYAGKDFKTPGGYNLDAVIDMDGDGTKDLVFYGKGKKKVRVYFMTKGSKTAVEAFLALPTKGPKGATLVGIQDVNGDGYYDFVWTKADRSIWVGYGKAKDSRTSLDFKTPIKVTTTETGTTTYKLPAGYKAVGVAPF